jgi:VWFA-related protein
MVEHGRILTLATAVLAGSVCAAIPLTARQAPQDPVLQEVTPQDVDVTPQDVAPQEAAPQEPSAPAPVFRSESDLVVLHVNVFDGRSDAVPNLPQSAFQVAEDGQPQAITFFNNVDVPVAVGLVVDNSGSMITRRGMVLAGTRAFAQSSHDEDELFAIVFNENVRLGLPETVAFTRSRPQIEAALTRFQSGGRTALHDAVVAGLEHLQEATHQKRVLVVLSDGEDNASQHSADDMLERARRSDALIYVVSTAELGTNIGNPRLLKKLAGMSGGVAYTPDSEAEVVEAFTEIAQNIRRGYSIGYAPTNAAHDGRYRRVKVTVRAPGLRNLSVSARDGYLAPRHAESR